ncbi:response regulator [Hylemonella gracilis]|uniref:histidine kinase n=1 Tax=Hylemonella gracilis TaxID=80880 RepID=A0A4P6UM66_9BURK|nr:ATP-binding protein [Hylemonella gracilis]QBK05786.1 response regulator [Hylemonella gracilis]
MRLGCRLWLTQLVGRMRVLRLCLLLTGLSTPWAHATTIDACADSQQLLGGKVEVHVDGTGRQTPEEIARLPASAFAPLDPQTLPRYSEAGVWLDMTLHNTQSQPCRRWLNLAKPSVEDQQVHVLRVDGLWHSQRSGSAYALRTWAVAQRQPVFLLDLQPGETTRVLARVSSTSSILLVNPQLYSDAAWLQTQQNTHIIDGLSQGIVLLVVAVGLTVGWILRSGMLLALSVGALFNALFVCVVNGYLFYFPALLPYTEACAAVTGTFAISGFLIYVRQLYGLSRLPRLWTHMIVALVGFYILTRIVGWYAAPAMTSIGLWVIVSFVAVLLHGRRHQFMAWLGMHIMALQLLSQYVFHLDKAVPWAQHFPPALELLSSLVWQSSYVQNLSGTLNGAVWLAATMVLEVLGSQRREQRAQAALENQRRGELERLESAVAQRTGQLREALDARRNLLARISHDLRSPLAGIINITQSAAALEAQTTRHIERSARRQMELIDELLEFARQDLKGPEIHAEPGYLYALLHEMEQEGRLLAQRQQNRFETEIPIDLPLVVRADFRHLRQVLLNLMGNAAKFTTQGEIRLQVEPLDGDERETGNGRTRLRFSVCDTGQGIAESERDKVMQPFGRGANARGVDGVGLGLTIVRQLLDGMGTELELASTPGQGSRFSFALDLELADESEVRDIFVESHAAEVEGRGRRILVADDLPANRDQLTDLLGGYGFEVSAAADGLEALQMLREDDYDLLLTDQMMPRMDGWELLAQARASRPRLPVLLYSAAPPLPPLDWPADLGFDASLLKPATSGELLRQIDSLVRAAGPSAQ